MHWPIDDRLTPFFASLTRGIAPPPVYAVKQVADPSAPIDIDRTVRDEI